MKVVLKMPFMPINKAEINFAKSKLNWKMYTLYKTLPIIKRMQMINQKKLTSAALGLDKEAFIVHLAYLDAKIFIYLASKV